jgi:Tfp pilus assembly protein PilF
MGIAITLDNLGLVAQREGKYAMARALLQESLTLRREVGDKEGIARVLKALAQTAAAEGKGAHAVRLHAASMALYEAMGMHWDTPELIAEYERVLDAIRATLGEAAFAEAWEAGRAMLLEEAIEHALEEAPRA